MARGPLITDRIKILIAQVHKEHPKWKAPMVRNEVDSILYKGKLTRWPSLSTVQKVLAKVRKGEREPSPLDKPWSTGTLDQYPEFFTPESVSGILRAWKFCIEAGGVPNVVTTVLEAYEEVMGVKLILSGGFKKKAELEKLEEQLSKSGYQLSIRDAKWVARFSNIIADTGQLIVTARLYSEMEQIYQFIGKPFDTTDLDRGIIEHENIQSYLSKEASNERPHNKKG